MAGAMRERLRAAARRAGIAAEIDLAGAFLLQHRPPVTAQDFSYPRYLVLLDQEVCLGASTLAAAWRAADEDGNPRSQTTIAQQFHVGDRARHDGHQRKSRELLLGVGDAQRFHDRILDLGPVTPNNYMSAGPTQPQRDLQARGG